ncbi:MAG: sulfatase [Patescibacteria group bacterium]
MTNKNKKYGLIILVFCILVSVLLLLPRQPVSKYDESLNFIVVVSDDQRADTLWAMENLQREFLAKGVKFDNGFVTTPLCCPSRANILTGLYGHNTGVLRNNPPHGGFSEFDDTQSLGLWLQQAGYTTALVGKYLNGYEQSSPSIPPGWSKWIAFTKIGYDKFTLNLDGKIKKFQKNDGVYSTDLLFEKGINFIKENEKKPFFLYLAPYSAHGPATPKNEDKKKFADFLNRPVSYNEENLNDKPAFYRGVPLLEDVAQEKLDEFARDQLRSLQSLDRNMKMLFDELKKLNLLKKTVVIYIGDNGYQWGEHRLIAKGLPYEESIKVPFLIAVPGINPRTDKDNLVLNIDLAPTILELANISKPPNWEFDGKSIINILKNPEISLRDDFFIEILTADKHKKNDQKPRRSFWGVRTKDYKLVEYSTGDREFYDLKKDPFEMDNQYNSAVYRQISYLLEPKLAYVREQMSKYLSAIESQPEIEIEDEGDEAGEGVF